MATLAHRGYRSLRLEEFASGLHNQNDERTFLLTFDDAYTHVDEAVTPVLQRHGFSAVMFVPWAHVGLRNTWDRKHARLAGLEIASARQLRGMLGVWELACHGCQHVDLRSQPSRSRRRDLATARWATSELVGRSVTEIAYPFGCHDAGVRRDAAAVGFELGFTTDGLPTSDLLQLPRRPIHGDDGRIAFRAKTEPAAAWLYRLKSSSAGLAGSR
jgi:peptidoglycan/xylan/chitin deacetylase (PgdA/CDA1 family)